MFEELERLNTRRKKYYDRPLVLINYILEELDKEVQLIADVGYKHFGEALVNGEARDIWKAYDLIENESHIIADKLIEFIKRRTV